MNSSDIKNVYPENLHEILLNKQEDLRIMNSTEKFDLTIAKEDRFFEIELTDKAINSTERLCTDIEILKEGYDAVICTLMYLEAKNEFEEER